MREYKLAADGGADRRPYESRRLHRLLLSVLIQLANRDNTDLWLDTRYGWALSILVRLRSGHLCAGVHMSAFRKTRRRNPTP